MAYIGDEAQPLLVMAEAGTSSSAGLAIGTPDVDHRACTMASQLNILSFIGKSPVRGQWGWSGGPHSGGLLAPEDSRHCDQ